MVSQGWNLIEVICGVEQRDLGIENWKSCKCVRKVRKSAWFCKKKEEKKRAQFPDMSSHKFLKWDRIYNLECIRARVRLMNVNEVWFAKDINKKQCVSIDLQCWKKLSRSESTDLSTDFDTAIEVWSMDTYYKLKCAITRKLIRYMHSSYFRWHKLAFKERGRNIVNTGRNLHP